VLTSASFDEIEERAMRAVVIERGEYGRAAELLDQMFRLRAQVFDGRLGWDVAVEEGREVDGYDDVGPTYVLAVDARGTVVGSVRLLPALGPNMLAHTFPQLLATGRLDAHARMIEASRFCVDTAIGGGRRGQVLNDATLTLFAGVIEWSMRSGFDEIVMATDVRFERILKRARWPMQRLGEVTLIGETPSVAGLLPANRISFETVRPPRYVFSRLAPLSSAA